MADHNDFGKKAEQLAADYLSEKGYQILERNYRSGKAEIDIIAFFENQIIIVEVKARAEKRINEPKESVNAAKRKLLIQAANDYIEQNERVEEVRFDIVSIIKKGKNFSIEHIPEAFLQNDL